MDTRYDTIPFMHNSHHLYCCHVCKRPTKKINCSGCRTISYCSTLHQRKDWKNHKVLCNVIRSEGQGQQYPLNDHAEFLMYKKRRAMLWILKLGRNLMDFENQMWMFQRACGVCYKQNDLIHCPKCFSEFYCCEEHQQNYCEIHEKFCEDLKLALDMNIYLYFNSNSISTIFQIASTKDLTCIPENSNFISQILKSDVLRTEPKYLIGCDQIMSGVSIIFALEKSSLIIKRKLLRTSLEIHIVGASAFEQSLNWPLILEIFFHWIKNLEVIYIVFIGPELQTDTVPFQLFVYDFCNKCKGKKRIIVKDANFYNSMYHEKVISLDKPDIVVAFNSGLHEFAEQECDTWKHSLSALICNSGVPLLLTAYTLNEINQDLERLMKIANVDLEVVYGPKKNPFSNLRPLRDWETKDIPVYFINNFIAIVKQKD